MSVSVMKRLTVITRQDDASATVKRLVRLKCIQVTGSDGLDYGSLLKNMSFDMDRSAIEKRISVLEKILPYLNKRTKRKGSLGDNRKKINRDEYIKGGQYEKAWEIAALAENAISGISEAQAQIQSCRSQISALNPWAEYDAPLDFVGSKHTNLTLGALPVICDFDAVSEISKNSLCSVQKVGEDGDGIYICVITHKSSTEKLLKYLTQQGFLKVAFKDMSGTPKEEISLLQAEISELEQKLCEYEKTLCSCSDSLDDIEILWDIEQTNRVIVENKQKLSATEKCAVMSAWVPEQNSEKVTKCLEKISCAFEIYDPAEGDEPPVQLRNNKFAENFEWVVGMYSYPKYGSFDPTFIMSIFYFFIFGLMFADVGYGLLVVLGGFLAPKVIKLSPNMKKSFYMFGYCGIASMIMGVFFGGWFGDLPYAIMQNFMGIENAKEVVPFFNGILFNPIDNPMAFLIVSLAAGGVHLIAGMIIQFCILCKQGKVLDAIFDIASWWIIFAGIGLLVLVSPLVGGITIGVGVLMIVTMKARDQKNPIMRILKGLLGLYDVTSYASDLLSYSRILALGLASAVIAQVINLIGTMVGPTVGGFIALVLAFLIGHTLNLAINVLGAFVHTSRLQYLEFFGKFYEDGGDEFKVAEPSEKYTID